MKNNKTDEIASLFFSAFRALKQKTDLNNPLYNLPMAHVETLRFIEEKKQSTMKEVADFLAITPPSATVLINNLVVAGFITRKSSSSDRRTVHLQLTKKGDGVLQKGIKQRCGIFKHLLDNLSVREQLDFLKILKKMAGTP